MDVVVRNRSQLKGVVALSFSVAVVVDLEDELDDLFDKDHSCVGLVGLANVGFTGTDIGGAMVVHPPNQLYVRLSLTSGGDLVVVRVVGRRLRLLFFLGGGRFMGCGAAACLSGTSGGSPVCRGGKDGDATVCRCAVITGDAVCLDGTITGGAVCRDGAIITGGAACRGGGLGRGITCGGTNIDSDRYETPS